MASRGIPPNLERRQRGATLDEDDIKKKNVDGDEWQDTVAESEEEQVVPQRNSVGHISTLFGYLDQINASIDSAGFSRQVEAEVNRMKNVQATVQALREQHDKHRMEIDAYKQEFNAYLERMNRERDDQHSPGGVASGSSKKHPGDDTGESISRTAPRLAQLADSRGLSEDGNLGVGNRVSPGPCSDEPASSTTDSSAE